jgi:hypothetical protein
MEARSTEEMSDWKSELERFFQEKSQHEVTNAVQLVETTAEVLAFYSNVVIPAFEELKTELEKHQRKVLVTRGDMAASIEVEHNGQFELKYSVRVRIGPRQAFPYPATQFRDKSDGKIYRAEGELRSGLQDYSIAEITKDEIIKHFLTNYKMQISL